MCQAEIERISEGLNNLKQTYPERLSRKRQEVESEYSSFEAALHHELNAKRQKLDIEQNLFQISNEVLLQAQKNVEAAS